MTLCEANSLSRVVTCSETAETESETRDRSIVTITPPNHTVLVRLYGLVARCADDWYHDVVPWVMTIGITEVRGG